MVPEPSVKAWELKAARRSVPFFAGLAISGLSLTLTIFVAGKCYLLVLLTLGYAALLSLSGVHERGCPFYRSGFGRKPCYVPSGSRKFFDRFRIHGKEYWQRQHCSYSRCGHDRCMRYILSAD
jgi:hypothetical protein